jgi:hypothetical protein
MVPQFALPPLELFHWTLLQSPHLSLMPLYLLDYHKQNLENSFDKLPTYTSKNIHQLYVKLDSSLIPLQNILLQPPIPQILP